MLWMAKSDFSVKEHVPAFTDILSKAVQEFAAARSFPFDLNELLRSDASSQPLLSSEVCGVIQSHEFR
jgi:hypothetical protein